jgi:hypothetical protein
MSAASFKEYFALMVMNATPAAKVPNAKAITIDRVISNTTAVETDAETPMRSESFTHATKWTKANQ